MPAKAVWYKKAPPFFQSINIFYISNIIKCLKISWLSGNFSQLYGWSGIICISIVVETEGQLGFLSCTPSAVPRGTGWKPSLSTGGSQRRWVCELLCVYVKNLRALELWLCWWRRGMGLSHPHTCTHRTPQPSNRPVLNEHPDTPIMQQCFQTVLPEFAVRSTLCTVWHTWPSTFATASHKAMQLPFTVCWINLK